MSYSEKELSSLMADVEKEFSKHLAKAEEAFNLAKSEDGFPKKEETEDEGKKESKKPMESEKPEDKGVKDQHQQDTSKEDKGQPMESKEERSEDDKKENEKPSEDPHGEAESDGYDDEDRAHMHSMYSSMSRPELKAHHDAVRKCMDSHGLAKCEDGMVKSEMEDAKEGEHRPNGGPKDGESAKCKTPPSSDAQALEKSEPSMEISLLKSELEASKAESEKSKKNLEAVESFLKKFVEKTAPAGKAITSLDIIAKTENGQSDKPLQKSEIDARLLSKAKDPSLSKSDRDAINSYYCGSKNIQTVSHLLK